MSIGLTGTNPDHPGLGEALAACRAGDTLLVTKLDRLARQRCPPVRRSRLGEESSKSIYDGPPDLEYGTDAG